MARPLRRKGGGLKAGPLRKKESFKRINKKFQWSLSSRGGGGKAVEELFVAVSLTF